VSSSRITASLIALAFAAAGCSKSTSTQPNAPEDFCGRVEPGPSEPVVASSPVVSGLSCVYLKAPALLQDGAEYKMWFGCNGGIALAGSPDGEHWSDRGAATFPTHRWLEGGVFAPTVLRTTSGYRMWLTAFDLGDTSRILGFQSTDGLNWTFLVPAIVQSPADSIVFQFGSDPSVDLHDGRYTMWTGVEGRHGIIIRMTSSDGVRWSSELRLVMAPGQDWEKGGIGAPTVIRHGGQFHMWYDAWNADYTQKRIGYARSGDGAVWVKCAANPVLLPTSDAWRNGFVSDPAAIVIGDRVRLYFSGQPSSAPYASGVGFDYPLPNCIAGDCFNP
jgi:predicted GH43/DUF377 family glycosyl hydrolase